ncbi:MAG: hypothetical protein Q4Q14_02880 [Methanobrevibacter sp.]|nr:hypothetical protein [Methanobrevibacter sp.]
MNDVDKLVISFKFPPSDDVSGIVVAKRIIKQDSPVDVLQNEVDESEYLNFDIIDKYINERFVVSADGKRDSHNQIKEFIDQSFEYLNERDVYANIYSRSWYMANHFLAMEYKFKHPEVFWTAEFSDPVSRKMDGTIRMPKASIVENEKYLNKLNSKIAGLNNDFKPLDMPNVSYFIAEYLTLIFADEIIFTNPNQREIMLEIYDDDFKRFVIDKSVIMPHPTLDDEFYHLEEHNMELDENDVNIAYFGNIYYISRHFEALFYAFDSLNHKYKDRLKFHLFLNNDHYFKILINDLDIKENIILRKPLRYFEFLNATTQFDVLLINDTITKDFYKINPYLPSKLSDYKGSHIDIWAIYENGSVLSTQDVKYKSSMTDYTQSTQVLVDILKDNGYDDESYTLNDSVYENRITQLNLTMKKEVNAKNRYRRQIKKLKKENKRLKEENEKILSSNSWKITKPLRKLRNK